MKRKKQRLGEKAWLAGWSALLSPAPLLLKVYMSTEESYSKEIYALIGRDTVSSIDRVEKSHFILSSK